MCVCVQVNILQPFNFFPILPASSTISLLYLSITCLSIARRYHTNQECIQTILNSRVPRDKAKKVTGRITLVQPTLAKERKSQGAYIAPATDVKFYCVSCAVRRG